MPATKAGPLRQLIALAIPVSATNLLAMGLGITDAVVVGRHSTAELAQLSLAWALNGTLLIGTMGLLMGVQVLVARALGAGEPSHVGTIWRRGVVTGFWAGLAMGGLLYIGAEPVLSWMIKDPELIAGGASCARILALSMPVLAIFVACGKTFDAQKRAHIPMFVMIGANILNLGANLVLVPQMGADGAAWATVMVRVFTAIAILMVILSRTERAKFGLLDLKADQRSTVEKSIEAKEQLSIGLSAMGSRLLEAGAFNAMTVFAGQVGTQTVASFSVFLNILSVFFMPAMGFASATSVLTANARGAGDTKGSIGVVWLGFGAALVYGLAIGGLCLLIPSLIAGGFSRDPQLIAAAASVIALIWLIGAFDFTQVVLAEALRALGMNWFPAISHLGSYALVMAPLGWLLCVHFGRGAQGLVEAIIMASMVSACLLMGRFLIYRHQAIGSK